MTLQNRVTPFGEIVAVPSRGLFMGNRGILHDENQNLGTSRWRHPHWVTCALSFKGRKRVLMGRGTYTELFFLDEPTALAAGHRPCAECRRQDFERFLQGWAESNGMTAKPTASSIDALLHRQRVNRERKQITFETDDILLPNGTMIALDGQAWLVWEGHKCQWSFAGYLQREPLTGAPVTVLTPLATVSALKGGYVPKVHESLHEHA